MYIYNDLETIRNREKEEEKRRKKMFKLLREKYHSDREAEKERIKFEADCNTLLLEKLKKALS